MSDSYDWEKMDKAMQAQLEAEMGDPPEPEEPVAWHDFYITTTNPFHGGVVVVHEETNDNDDDGYPDPEGVVRWELEFHSLEDALKHAGHKSHRGVSGVRVRVYVNGVERV